MSCSVTGVGSSGVLEWSIRSATLATNPTPPISTTTHATVLPRCGGEVPTQVILSERANNGRIADASSHAGPIGVSPILGLGSPSGTIDAVGVADCGELVEHIWR